jgi:plasmid replication initiation protein
MAKKDDTKKPVTKKLKRVTKTIAKMENSIINDPIVNEVIQKSIFDGNIFMFMISQIGGEKDNVIYLTSEMVKKQIGYKKHTSLYEFAKKLDETFNYIGSLKLHKKTVYKENGKTRVDIKRQILFNSTEVNFSTDDYWCKIQMSEECVGYFNNLKKNFTRFSVTEFFNIKSKNSRIVYLFIKPWRTVGEKEITPEDLIERLNINNASAKKNPAQYLRTKVFPIVSEELSAVFPQFRIEREKYNRKIRKYKFTWIPEAQNQEVVLPKIVEASISIKNIRENKYLPQASKYKAIDRYYGWKIGTAKKIINSAQKNVSYFVYDPKDEKDKVAYHRPMLARVSKIELKSLEKLIEIYHSIEDKLTDYDREDLRYLESHKVFLQVKANDKKYKKADNKKFEIPKGAKIISEETELALPDFNRNDNKQLDMFSNFDDDSYY